MKIYFFHFYLWVTIPLLVTFHPASLHSSAILAHINFISFSISNFSECIPACQKCFICILRDIINNYQPAEIFPHFYYFHFLSFQVKHMWNTCLFKHFLRYRVVWVEVQRVGTMNGAWMCKQVSRIGMLGSGKELFLDQMFWVGSVSQWLHTLSLILHKLALQPSLSSYFVH